MYMGTDKSDSKRCILLKIGSNTLTKGTDVISRDKIADIARQISKLQDQYQFVIVSSGAITAAKEFVELDNTNSKIEVKQALASIGQPFLMRLFQETFAHYNLLTSQCLLSYADFENEKTQKNISNTIRVLLDNNYIPIINENDTVSTDEIKFGDNDKLAALTSALLKVDLCMIATNTDGIYTKASMGKGTPETIKKVLDIETLINEVSDEKSSHGTGGMESKIVATNINHKANIDTWIVNGHKDNFITDAIKNKSDFTKILGYKNSVIDT